MAPSAKNFAERLNTCLDDTGAPTHTRERSAILGKMLDISKHVAGSLLQGYQLPDQSLLLRIAHEFEVDPQWLTGDK